MALRRRPNWKREKIAWAAGELLCGVDEVGTGALAGPVFAAAVIFPKYVRAPLLMDCKLLRPDERIEGAGFLMRHAIWAIGRSEVTELNDLGLRPATLLAMRRAVEALSTKPHRLAVDAWTIPGMDMPQEGIIRGDYEVASIAAASMIAKFHRDQVMIALEGSYPGYGFHHHKGYGTKEHHCALARLGVTGIHRKHWKSIQEYEKNQLNTGK